MLRSKKPGQCTKSQVTACRENQRDSLATFSMSKRSRTAHNNRLEQSALFPKCSLERKKTNNNKKSWKIQSISINSTPCYQAAGKGRSNNTMLRQTNDHDLVYDLDHNRTRDILQKPMLHAIHHLEYKATTSRQLRHQPKPLPQKPPNQFYQRQFNHRHHRYERIQNYRLQKHRPSMVKYVSANLVITALRQPLRNDLPDAEPFHLPAFVPNPVTDRKAVTVVQKNNHHHSVTMVRRQKVTISKAPEEHRAVALALALDTAKAVVRKAKWVTALLILGN